MGMTLRLYCWQGAEPEFLHGLCTSHALAVLWPPLLLGGACESRGAKEHYQSQWDLYSFQAPLRGKTSLGCGKCPCWVGRTQRLTDPPL